MSNTDLEVRIARIEANTENLIKSFEDLRVDIKQNYATKSDLQYMEKYFTDNVNDLKDKQEKTDDIVGWVVKTILGAIISLILSALGFLLFR
jgi:vacuolar-type H+-ATPase subunit I/STV1